MNWAEWREKFVKAAKQDAQLFSEVAAAFREIGESAAMVAYGFPAVCDLSPGGALARLAQRAITSSQTSVGYHTRAELQRAVDALRGIAAGDCSAGEAEKRMREFLTWRNRWESEIDGAPGRVARDYTDSVRALAGRLAADCKANAARAEEHSLMLWQSEILKAREEAREAQLQAEVAEQTAKAEKAIADLHEQRKQTEEAKAALTRAKEASKKKKRLQKEAKEKANLAEVLRKISAQFAEIKDTVKATQETTGRIEKKVERALDGFETELERELKRRAELAMKMADLKEKDPKLWKFVCEWEKGGTQKEIAGRMGWKSQGTVSKYLDKLKRLYPGFTIDPADGGRVHNSRKAKVGSGTISGNFRTGSDRRTEIQPEPEGGWVGEDDME